MGMWGPIAGGLTAMIPGGAAFAPMVSSAVDAFTDSKVDGVPTPEVMTGSDQGSNYRGFLDEAFPGTTPWERLGANTPMGAIDSAHTQARSQQMMQNRELQNRKDVAEGTNRASIISAGAPHGPQAIDAMLGKYQGSGVPGQGGTSDYDTFVRQAREKMPFEMRHLDAGIQERIMQAAYNEAQTPLARERSDRAPQIVDAEIASRYGNIIKDILFGIGGAAAGVMGGKFTKGVRPITKYVLRTGKRNS